MGRKAVAAGVRDAYAGELVSFPPDGTRYSFPPLPAGSEATVDLRRGLIRVPPLDREFAGNGALVDLDADECLSAQIWADQDLRVTTVAGDVQTGVWETDQCTYLPLDAIRVDRAKIQSPQPFNFRAQFSTGVVAPLDPVAVANHQDRFGFKTTTDTFEAVPFTSPSAADLGVEDKQTAVDQFGLGAIHAANIGQTVWIIENTDANNDAEVELRVRHQSGEAWTRDPTTANQPITASADGTTLIESNLHSHIKQIRARSSVDGSPADLRVQYRGYSPGMR